MTHTVVGSATKTVVIGDDHPMYREGVVRAQPHWRPSSMASRTLH